VGFFWPKGRGLSVLAKADKKYKNLDEKTETSLAEAKTLFCHSEGKNTKYIDALKCHFLIIAEVFYIKNLVP